MKCVTQRIMLQCFQAWREAQMQQTLMQESVDAWWFAVDEMKKQREEDEADKLLQQQEDDHEKRKKQEEEEFLRVCRECDDKLSEQLKELTKLDWQLKNDSLNSTTWSFACAATRCGQFLQRKKQLKQLNLASLPWLLTWLLRFGQLSNT